MFSIQSENLLFYRKGVKLSPFTINQKKYYDPTLNFTFFQIVDNTNPDGPASENNVYYAVGDLSFNPIKEYTFKTN